VSYKPDSEAEGKEGWLMTLPKETTRTLLILKIIILKREGDTEQMRINYFVKKMECKLDLAVEIISLVYVF
jgi:hypothetical protein